MPKSTYFLSECIPTFAQIFESGSATPTASNYAATRGSDWDAFVASVPACANTVGTNATIACLRNANLDAATLINATEAALSASDEGLPYVPTLDGELYPALSSELLCLLAERGFDDILTLCRHDSRQRFVREIALYFWNEPRRRF